jgi:RNA polymerase sigma factor (sigma-70 family)
MDDILIIQRCIQRDPYAWNEFLATYSRLIYSTIYSILRVKRISLDSSRIEDIFQEMIMMLMKDDYHKLRSFQSRNGCTLGSWLRVVVSNFMISYVRSSKTERLNDSLDEDNDSVSQLNESSGEVAGLSQDMAAQLDDCIRKLTVDDRYFLTLHVQQSLTIEQLKRFFHVSRGALDMRKSRLMGRLKECFRKKGFNG